MLALSLALSVLTPVAQADDFWRVLGDGGTVLPAGDIVYNLRNGAGVSVNVTTTLGDLERGSGFSELTITAFKFRGHLNQQELQLFSDHIIRLASECFNIDPARGPSIKAWILSTQVNERSFYQTVPEPSSVKMFGPLKLDMTRWANTQAHAMTIWMTRTGTPGTAPWNKSCLPSG